MLNRLPNWYRIVNLAPVDATIQQREAAAKALLEKLADTETLLSVTALATLGLPPEPTAAQLLAARTTFECIRTSHPAFAEDYQQNALDLRVCAATALGELVAHGVDTEPEPDGVAAAALIVSALEGRPQAGERYLREMLLELLAAARDLLNREALARRNRTAEIQVAADSADAQAPLKLIPPMGVAVNQLAQNALADREELNILWWVFGGHSVTSAEPFSALPVGAAVLAAGVELANLALMPPPPNTELLLAASLAAHGAHSVSLRSLAADWRAPFVDLLLTTSSELNDAIRNHAGLLPLSWLAQRLKESGSTTSWEQEYHGRTGLQAEDGRAIAKWSLQIFRERVAQRLVPRVTE